MSLTVAQIAQREAYISSFYSGTYYPTTSRAHLAAICDDNQREFKLHLQGWDVASEDYFTLWSESAADLASRSYTFTEQAILFPPTGWERVVLTPRMRVYVELTSGGSPAAALVRLEWSDALSGSN